MHTHTHVHTYTAKCDEPVREQQSIQVQNEAIIRAIIIIDVCVLDLDIWQMSTLVSGHDGILRNIRNFEDIYTSIVIIKMR